MFDRQQDTRFAAIVLLAAAALLALPATLGPVRLNDSFWIDLVWLQQFAAELGKGVVYPRWLPLSHNGLGSPVFYYYPPLAFYAGSIFVLAGLATFPALVATFFAASFLSGLGVYLWLREQTRLPLAGALLFMIAPYQLFNFYQRGAVAEFLAAAFMPFVLWGIRQMIEGRPRAFAYTALAYAALIMSHLPLTLLATLFLFAPYGFLTAKGSPRTLARISFALAAGVALAAIYLLPAIALDQSRSSSDLWALPYLRPTAWSLWNPESWKVKTYQSVLLVSAALAIPLVFLIIRHRCAWALWALACLLLAAGAVPWFWSLPVLQWVQFPFRLLPVAELAFITALVLAPRERAPWLVAWVAFGLMAAFIIAAQPEGVPFEDRVIEALHPDVPENLPPGKRPYSWPSRWALEVARTHRAPQFDGKVTVEPVFYFPAWEVRCSNGPVRAFPDPSTQLLAYEGHRCSRRIVWTSPEVIGAMISLLALLVLAAAWFRSGPSPSSPEQRRSPRRGSPPRNT